MTEKTLKPPSTFSKYTKGLLSRPQTGASNDSRGSDSKAAQPKSRDLCYHADSAITAIATSPDMRQVVIAGREVLKILTIGLYEIEEKHNLRANHRTNLSYASNDVKWGIGATSGLIASATSNGSIVVWDLEYASSRKVDRVIHGHNRAVNRLDFNPGNGSWLLSASQDGSMKLWDLRERDGSARFVMHGKAEAVRDVSFNSTNALELAAVYDNGTLQKWDLRNPKIYERKLNAHNGLALALDWHADGKHLASGGRDKIIKIWDLSSDMRKPVRYIQTMAPVARITWRPGSSATNCELASCAFSMDNDISLWDLRRPYIASRTFVKHTAVPTGILWKSSDILLSCSKDQTFRQNSVQLASEPVNMVSHYAFGWNTVNDIAICLGDRQDDKTRIKALHQLTKSHNSSQVDLLHELSEFPEFQQGDRPYQLEILNPRASIFTPKQAFAIVFADDDDSKLFKHLAAEYNTSNEYAIRACAHNALIAHQARQPEASKAWKLIKLGLEHLDRARRRGPRQRKPSLNQSLTMSRLGDSLIRRDLERLRSTPQIPDSGRTTMRGSPATSFIMPKYIDSVPPLSLPTLGEPMLPKVSGSPALLPPRDQASHKASTESPLNGPVDMILPTPATITGAMNHGSIPSNDSDVALLSQQTSQTQTGATCSPISPPRVSTPRPQSVATSSPRLNTSMLNSREYVKGSLDVLEEVTVGMDRAREDLWKTVSRILRHYQDLGDVQMCSSVCLVLGDRVQVSSQQVDEWLYCYVDLLRRHRLFTTASEVINGTSSDFIRAQADGDIVMQTTCTRCKKAVPLVREVGDYWMCPRCQNTVLCIVCGVVIKGAGSWCRLCAHTAHHKCRQLLDREDLGGACVVPDCHCDCQGFSRH